MTREEMVKVTAKIVYEACKAEMGAPGYEKGPTVTEAAGRILDALGIGKEPVAWRAYYTDVRGHEVWSGAAWTTEIQGIEWCDKFKDLKPTLVPLYALTDSESDE